MTTYQECVQRNGSLADCHRRDPAAARALWLAITGGGEPELDSYAEAALDTAPAEHVALLTEGGTAAAYAVARLFEHWPRAEQEPSFERRELARQSWAKFCERAEQADQVSYGLGFDEAEAWECTRDFDIQRDTKEVLRIAQLAGRIFVQLSRARAEQVTVMPEEIHSVTLGDHLERLLFSELVHLGQPTEVLLLERIANHGALEHAFRSTEEVGRGPLVIALDESGSMHGRRGEWSKAAAIAMARLCWEDQRPVVVVHWSTSVALTELRPGDGRAMFRMIKHWFGGGNRCWMALDAAAAEVERLRKHGDRGADVVLVTDGVETITDKHLAALDAVERTGAQLWTVAVECAIDTNNPLRARAVEYVPIGGTELVTGELGAMAGAVL